MPVTTTATSELLSARLFGSEQSNLHAWMENTQARIDARLESMLCKPLPLSSQLNLSHDHEIMQQLCAQVERAGFACYEFVDEPSDITNSVSRLLNALSLFNSDQGVMREIGDFALLQDLSGTPKGRFPPYQPNAMNWHTDGYYNDANESIRSFTLHCMSPAADGGALLLMDDAYLVFALWQADPELLLLLSHPEAMTLPGNKDMQGHDRPDRSVPVILRNADQSISMRFTTRTKNIRWRCLATKAAAERANELINAHPHWQTRIKLQKDQGIITRNVLHAREAFVDAPGKPNRQMLRGRFASLPRFTSPTESVIYPAEQNHVAPE